MKEDIHGFTKILERNIDKLLNSENSFFEEDKRDLRKFYQWLVAEGVSAGRIIKYFFHLKTLSKMLGKTFRKASKEDIIELIGNFEEIIKSEGLKVENVKNLENYHGSVP